MYFTIKALDFIDSAQKSAGRIPRRMTCISHLLGLGPKVERVPSNLSYYDCYLDGNRCEYSEVLGVFGRWDSCTWTGWRKDAERTWYGRVRARDVRVAVRDLISPNLWCELYATLNTARPSPLYPFSLPRQQPLVTVQRICHRWWWSGARSAIVCSAKN